jgi:hypothetical protein
MATRHLQFGALPPSKGRSNQTKPNSLRGHALSLKSEIRISKYETNGENAEKMEKTGKMEKKQPVARTLNYKFSGPAGEFYQSGIHGTVMERQRSKPNQNRTVCVAMFFFLLTGSA